MNRRVETTKRPFRMRNVTSRPHPSVGSEFERKYEEKLFRMKVVEVDGRVCYEVAGKVYASPSSAASSITKGSVNGWKFWGLD